MDLSVVEELVKKWEEVIGSEYEVKVRPFMLEVSPSSIPSSLPP